MSVILKQMEIGSMKNFLYFIGCDETKQVAVVDPAWEVDHILQEAEENGYHIVNVLLTHGHFDHSDGAKAITEQLGVPVYISKNEIPHYLPHCPDMKFLSDKDQIQVGNITVECLSTPGHAAGCMCFKCGDILLTGDTLFVNGCGRCDLPGSDPEAMYHSLYEVILKLPDSTMIYPGHRYGPWPHSTLEKQRKINRFLTCQSKEEFLETRMGF